jgi:hypothetical protein
MDDVLPIDDTRVLLTLLGCAFVLVLAWVMGGIAGLAEARSTEPAREPPPAPPAPQRFDAPERCARPIGRYLDRTIFDSIVIGGAEYGFDRVLPPGARWSLERGERCIAPGLVYVRR